MIELTRLNGETLFVNPDHIRFVEVCPDTLVTFHDGRTLMVKERPLQIAALIRNFRRKLQEEGPAIGPDAGGEA